jgi:hypothetical protein
MLDFACEKYDGKQLQGGKLECLEYLRLTLIEEGQKDLCSWLVEAASSLRSLVLKAGSEEIRHCLALYKKTLQKNCPHLENCILA